MADNLSHIQNLERCIFFGTLKKEDLSLEDQKSLEIYRQEKQKETNQRLNTYEQEKMKRFVSTVSSSLPTGSKNIKLLGENWFSFEFEENRYISYYYFLPNSTTPIFTLMTKITEDKGEKK